ncbi:MAG: hypothetical protein KAR85_02570 [Methanosarcinales archaeon]|nr:hypothetical protein [Methanosarcinales archaeon]
MMGTGTGLMGGFELYGFILNIILILIVVAVVIVLLNKSNYMAGGNEQLTRIEKDMEDVKKTVEEIKNKLDEI